VEPAAAPDLAKGNDLLVFEGEGPGPSFPPGGALVIGAPPERLPAPVPGAAREGEAVLDWDPKHPVTAALSFDGVFFRRFRPLPGAYAPLVTTGGGAVIGAREGPGGRAVVLSASLADTNLGLLSAFPLFVRNAMRWLGGDAVTATCPRLEPGHTRAPEGYSIRWEEGPAGGPGVAVLYREGEQRRLAVNFSCLAESTLEAPGTGPARSIPVPPESLPGADPRGWLLLGALALLLADWALLLFSAREPDIGHRKS
jgi:hypothetical protein